MIEQTGGCLCGDVRFKLNGAPYEIDYCHCHSCRKHTGSPGVRRGFCARCGSTLTYGSDAFPGELHVHVGATDRPEDFPPQGKSSFPEERVPWFHVADAVKR